MDKIKKRSFGFAGVMRHLNSHGNKAQMEIGSYGNLAHAVACTELGVRE